MGDFSVSCGMSGLSMHNTDVALFPLIPNVYEAPEGKMTLRGHSIVSNEGATALFEPWAFPIFGHLGDYGTLETIEEDYNTRSLEKRFNLKINEIADEICYPDKNNDFPKYHASMLVHRGVWNVFAGTGLDEWGKKIKLVDYKGTSRRTNWTKTITDWKRRRESELSTLEELKKTEGVEERTLRLFSTVSYYDLQYILSFGGRRDVEAVLDIYPDAMDSEDFYKAMEQLHCFRWNMMACNRLFMPTFNGYQYGNYYMTKKLAKLTAKIAQEHIKEYESWRDE